MTPVTDTRRTVDLYVRADAPLVEHRTALIDRLKRLDARDAIAAYRVHPWPRAISLDLVRELDHHEADDIPGLVREFETWAASQGRRIRPPFDVRTARSSYTGEADDLLVLPAVCLAAYDDGELVGVAPSTDGRSIYTVEDALEAIETGAAPTPPAPDDGPVAPPRNAGGILDDFEDDDLESPIAANPNASPPAPEP